jgi:S-adenosylmethionine:tRNA ribosyltransferase-isomerase
MNVTSILDFELDPAHEAHEPPEARGLRRDEVRLLVSPGPAEPVHTRFSALGAFLRPGDLVVANTSATYPAALDGRLPDGDPVVVHLSGALPDGVWLVEVRQPDAGATVPRCLDAAADIDLFSGGRIRLLARFADSRRLWVARIDVPGRVLSYAARYGRPIRYRHVTRDWPIGFYQSIFSSTPGSAEMPSAARPFTGRVLADLTRRGVAIATLVLDTGVSSLEGGERPYPERYEVSARTAATVNATRAEGGRVVALGTTVVRALATVTDPDGQAHAGSGWTNRVVSRDEPVPSVQGLLTGWHEPEASHLMMLDAIAGRPALESAYRAALDAGYLWHEFGDSHLLLAEDPR